MSLSTTRVSYATGEEATIVAQLTDLQGQPVTFAADQRPWVDFVAVWGHLRAADGFDSATGDSSGGERAVSIRTNTSGQAQALLRAEVGPELPLQAHLDVAATMTSTLASKATLAQAILQAPTPVDAKNAGAFTALATEYDRPTAISMRSYVDTYYVKNAPAVIGKIAPPVVSPRLARLRLDRRRRRTRGRRPDHAGPGPRLRLDPRRLPRLDRPVAPVPLLRPDRSSQPAIADIRTKLQPQFTADYFDSVDRLKNEVTTLVGPNRGLVGRIRDFQAVHGAFDGITVSQPAALVQKVSQTMQQVVVFQQAFEPVAGRDALGVGREARARRAHGLRGAGRDRRRRGEVAGRVDPVEGRRGRHAARRGARDPLHPRRARVGGEQLARDDLELGPERLDQVNKVQQLYPAAVRDQFLSLKGAVLDVQAIKKHLNLP